MQNKYLRIVDYLMHILGFAAFFMIIGYYLPKIYIQYFDKRVYYEITNPITVEKKVNYSCNYVDAYIHRKALVPIKGSSVRQLTLIRIDGKYQRIANFETPVQAEVGEATVIAHWQIPCDIPLGTYFFEGTLKYKVYDINRYTHFYTENFDIVATSSPKLKIN